MEKYTHNKDTNITHREHFRESRLECGHPVRALSAQDEEPMKITFTLNSKQRTFDITWRLIQHRAQQVPLFLIVFEDIHWIDSISLEMLSHVARRIDTHRILLLAVHRPTIELKEWKRYPHHNEIKLTDLPVEDALKLVGFKLGVEDVP